jgi:hypothetical protein
LAERSFRIQKSVTATTHCRYNVPTKIKIPTYKQQTNVAMNDHEEMEFKNDRGPGPKDMPDKTKTQEEPGNKGGYQGTNRSEREQGQRG